MMLRLPDWTSRSPEEAHLFNPAFLSSLLTEFVRAYGGKRDGVAPLPLSAIALGIVLHSHTRMRLPYSTITSLYEWLQKDEDLLIGFPERMRGFMAYFREGLAFGIAHDVLLLEREHYLALGLSRAYFPKSFVDETTRETKDIIDRTKFLGRWFAKSGSESSILAAWGVRP